MKVLDSDHKIEDVVYLKTDIEQKERIVSAVLVRKTHLVYYLVCGTEESSHYGFEISSNKDIIKLTNN